MTLKQYASLGARDEESRFQRDAIETREIDRTTIYQKKPLVLRISGQAPVNANHSGALL
jgi:hypothetical protein